jgi:hypothetical protein
MPDPDASDRPTKQRKSDETAQMGSTGTIVRGATGCAVASDRV